MITNEEFINKVKSIVGTEYVFLEKYQGSKKKIEVMHNCSSCGFNKFYVTPDAFFRHNYKGRVRCPICRSEQGRKPRISSSDFIRKVNSIVGDEYTVIGEYQGMEKHVDIKHNACGNSFSVIPGNFIRKGTRCPFCYGNNHKTSSNFIKEVKKLVGSDYSVLSNYKNATDKVSIRHNKCGNQYYVAPYSFLSGHRCPKCSNTEKGIKVSKALTKTNDKYLEELYEETAGTIKSLEPYVNSQFPIRHECTDCGHVFLAAPTDIINHGSRCPSCKGSSGEHKIKQILDCKNISYEYPKKFSDLKDKTMLHYDFYLPDYGILIEYQGEQHYHPISLFGGEEKFKTQKYHDCLKRSYAKEKGYSLVEICYKNSSIKEISDIINEELIQHRSAAHPS